MSQNALATQIIRYAPEILVCPLCYADLQAMQGGLSCTACKKNYSTTNGFINLITDPALKTLLVEVQYEAEHGLNEQRRITHWEQWNRILEKYQATTGDVLEIGAGAGYLTWGLLHRSNFSSVHISDISPEFLQMILEKHAPETNKPNYYYLCDANQLPFRKSSINYLMGNSMLHHILDYRKTLESAYAVLKPGGKAFFFEPVQQGKAFMSFLLRLIWKVDSQSTSPLFSEKQHTILRNRSIYLIKQEQERNERTDIESLSKLEDKYIFDIPALDRMAHDIGFSKMHVENNAFMDYSYLHYICHMLEPMGFDRKKLFEYRYLFYTVRDTLGVMIPESMTSPMVFLVFEK